MRWPPDDPADVRSDTPNRPIGSQRYRPGSGLRRGLRERALRQRTPGTTRIA
jgi:hypothetical protein